MDVYSSQNQQGVGVGGNVAVDKNWGILAILGQKITVSGLNMTLNGYFLSQNAFYHLNKVYIYTLFTLSFMVLAF